ncbi:MAG TPA: metalloregulator ArsR/SmtB family transcription factor [Gemmataceae bacterium]|jgi:DNA-binding transcriptional ArsR family regulator|nr:metalloregulator ArsR/SmtB family transcription factor [Gemmataceae bacterium]
MLDSMRQFKAGIFQALGHPTRVAIVEFLRHGEMPVSRLCEKVGVEQANASQHLAVLRNKHIVETRKDGNQIFYRLRDPLLGQVLETMREYFFAHLNEAMEMLREEKRGTKKAEPGSRK